MYTISLYKNEKHTQKIILQTWKYQVFSVDWRRFFKLGIIKIVTPYHQSWLQFLEEEKNLNQTLSTDEIIISDYKSTQYQDENVPHVKTLIREVEVISSKIKKDEEEGNVAGEWKYAAMVMDRFGDNSNHLFTFCPSELL